MSRSRLDWHRQCEAIVNGSLDTQGCLSDKDRERIAYALDSLVDLLLADKGGKP
jgi:hypothetical protein